MDSSAIQQRRLFDDTIDGAVRQPCRRILIVCNEKLGQALYIRAVRGYINAVRKEAYISNPEDLVLTRFLGHNALRVRVAKLSSSGSILAHGLRSPNTFINIGPLTHVFLELPSDTKQLTQLVSLANQALELRSGRLVMLSSSLLSHLNDGETDHRPDRLASLGQF